MNYDELAAFAQSMPRIPKRELKCHPLVLEALRWDTLHRPVHREPLARWYDFNQIPVYEDGTLAPGEWKLYEDGEVTQSGALDQEVRQ